MTTLRRYLIVAAFFVGLTLAVPILSAFQGEPTGFIDVIAKLSQPLLFLVLGAVGVTWIRKQERGPGGDIAAALNSVATELHGLSEKFGGFLLDQAREAEPRRRAVGQIEELSREVPASLAIVRSELAEHERMAASRAEAREDADMERHRDMTEAILSAVRTNQQRGAA